ncbi:MAG: DUF1553 domain-containing protein [Planctomyces sp.]|nr:DUF1553 domain-containing protein [Planctomyces sp.]
MTVTGRLLRVGLACVGLCSVGWRATELRGDEVRFNRDIRPILSDNCFACHGPSSAGRQADLRLDQREAAVEAGVLGPGDPQTSELLRRVLSEDPAEVMPPPEAKKTLTAEQKDLLQRWIAAGSEYEAHWAFLPVPRAIDVPAPDDSRGWIRNPIDAFVLDRLSREGLQPAPMAEKEQWLRRVSFDVTGLPPTLAELDAFLADDAEAAFDTAISRLLASPAHGERMARDWLDAARYADTFGYQADRDTHTWPWRDWVIRAFNENLPYDEFIVWQVAGDMLENATRDQQLATAFNRLHRQTNEGGSIEEEFRAEYVADRVRTMGSAFLGLTLECARCHDHKYDPITQHEYYALSAFFNNIDEHGLYSHFTETAPTPTLRLYEGDQEARHHELQQQVREKTAALDAARDRVRSRDRSTEPSMDGVEPPAAVAAYAFDDLQPSGDYRPVEGRRGQGIQFGGDDAYICADAPAFSRAAPFSLALWAKPGLHQPRQILAHRSRAAEDSAFRGFSLVLDDGIPVVSLVHFWPGNAIRVRAESAVPIGEWTHLAVTYDGGSRAAGVRLYINGRETPLHVERDALTRDIQHRAEWGDYDAASVQLSLGARFRDVGFKEGVLDDVQVFDRALTPLEAAAIASANVEPTDAMRLEQAWLADADCRAATAELQAARAAENDLISQVRQIMVMHELEERRPTHILARGAYDAPGEIVQPITPQDIFPLPDDLPRNRLGFAKWLVDERNPLTARVAVNRLWTQFFGRGLVATSQDFGSQGETPPHPELLDWLARDFMDSGWDVQRLIRLIALSSTYRQSSTPSDPSLYARDPANRLLARGPRHRLSAEELRDSALSVSGLMKPRLGGPSVFPYQPAGLWEESGTNQTYRQSQGDDLYRRSLYTFWRRTSPPPTMITFDAPSREYCVVERERTATPLQALTLLNDPQFVEAARAMAENLLQATEADDGKRLAAAFRTLTSRAPSDAERQVLSDLLRTQRSWFEVHPEAAADYVAVGESPRSGNVDAREHAAWTAVLQALMNYDECVTKR